MHARSLRNTTHHFGTTIQTATLDHIFPCSIKCWVNDYSCVSHMGAWGHYTSVKCRTVQVTSYLSWRAVPQLFTGTEPLICLHDKSHPALCLGTSHYHFLRDCYETPSLYVLHKRTAECIYLRCFAVDCCKSTNHHFDCQGHKVHCSWICQGKHFFLSYVIEVSWCFPHLVVLIKQVKLLQRWKVSLQHCRHRKDN